MTNLRLTNKEVISILKEAVAAMEVKEYNFFKVRAYTNAVSVLDNLTVSIYDLWFNKSLEEIPGLGKGIISHLDELFTKGKVEEFESIKEGLPDGMFGLLGLRGIGAKKAFKLASAFGLTNRETATEKLKVHAEKGEIQVLDGFGEKSEKDIIASLEQAKHTKSDRPRLLYIKAEEIVDRVISYMKECPEVLHIEAAGSFRRKQATIGDLDFPVATNEPEKVLEHFFKFPEIKDIISKGDKKGSVELTNEMQVDIRVSTPQAYGAMLQYFTGSKQHNVLLRTHTIEKKISLSEYGIKVNGELEEFANENDFYEFLGMQCMVPELRQGSDEIEKAIKRKIPILIERSDIKGDIHTHTIDSDGVNTIEDMAFAAAELGYEYIGIADHAPSVQTRGFDEVAKIIKSKRKAIEKFNDSQSKIKVLYGYEVNILADNTMAVPNELLKELDYVIGSVHTAFNQDSETVTQRLVAALENPYVTIIGHPSGRLINQRDPMDPKWDVVFKKAVELNKILEINAQPDRLDLTDDLVKKALVYGVRLIINSDAHSTDTLNYMKYGVNNARRGWATKENILNTKSYNEFVKELKLS